MAKLVVLTEGLKDRSHELTAERTTIGRVEDNTFQIMEASVSSHHCEILVRGSEVRVKDLNSTNGSFIDGQQITDSPLKPGQLLRLGKIELRLEGDAAAGAPKKPTDQTMVMQKGVSLNELEKGPKSAGFDTAGKGFAKKNNKTNLLFIIIVVVVMLAILGVLMKVIFFSGGTPPGR